MEVGQRVRVITSLDKGREGEIVGEFVMSVPPLILQVGGDETPKAYSKVKLDDGHTNLYPLDWVVPIG